MRRSRPLILITVVLAVSGGCEGGATTTSSPPTSTGTSSAEAANEGSECTRDLVLRMSVDVVTLAAEGGGSFAGLVASAEGADDASDLVGKPISVGIEGEGGGSATITLAGEPVELDSVKAGMTAVAEAEAPCGKASDLHVVRATKVEITP